MALIKQGKKKEDMERICSFTILRVEPTAEKIGPYLFHVILDKKDLVDMFV